jgi:threonine dehydratase
MPRTAPAVKREAVLRHGASIVECDPTETARIETLRSVVARTGAVEVHPYDDDQVIAGAGTAALELLDEAPGLDWLVVPVGGGGLASGTCIAAGGTAVLGTEPAGADDAARSLAAGRLLPQTAPETIADGLLTSLSPRTFGVLRGHGIRIVTVTDDETRAALAVVADATGQRIEPSSAVALAGLRRAVRAGIVDPAALVGLIITGGNV